MLQFPYSQVKAFQQQFDPSKGLRWGQAFHQFLKLERVTFPGDLQFCNKLYNTDDNTARSMVESRIDYSN